MFKPIFKLWVLTLVSSVAGCHGVADTGAASGTPAGLSYRGPIVGLAGKCLDARGASSADGTVVQLYTCNGTAAQEWTIIDGQLLGPGGKCVDVAGNVSDNGTAVQLWGCWGGPNQQWSLENGQLVGLGGRCLDIAGNISSDGTPAILWDCWGGPNQHWSLGGTTPPPPPAGDGPNSPYVPAGYDLVFSDEFNEAQLDTSKWWTRYVYSGGTLDSLNDELQRYRETNNHVMNGSTLKLMAYAPGDPRSENLGSGLFSSGMIRSKTTVKYGYFEARVKMPAGQGVWPAFWLNSEAQTWPPEIDIFEFVNNGVEDKANMLHTGVIDHGAQGSAFLYADSAFNTQWTFWTAPYSFADDFHVIGALWDGTTETDFVDGQRIVQRGYRWVHDDGSDGGYAHVLLNFAIGGQWAGRHGVDTGAFPQALEIDYVRVYQKSGSHDTSVSTTGHDLCPGNGGC
ncbi:MAG: Beta-glucanase precursor [Myxococcales bacterium]|nr:Beta-glucanase precursor [Myxococcales bacterium]